LMWDLMLDRSLSLVPQFRRKVYYSAPFRIQTPSYSWNLRFSIALHVCNTPTRPASSPNSFPVEQVPIDDYHIPLSSAEILKEGSDLTIISYGSPLYTISNTLDVLASPPDSLKSVVPERLRQAKIELIDLRTILPWDVDTIVKSVRKTGRCMIVHEAGPIGGVGSEIATEVQKRCFEKLEAPIRRVTGWDLPVGLQFEKFYTPDIIRVLDGIIETLSY